jgi:hypothetical protein
MEKLPICARVAREPGAVRSVVALRDGSRVTCTEAEISNAKAHRPYRFRVARLIVPRPLDATSLNLTERRCPIACLLHDVESKCLPMPIYGIFVWLMSHKTIIFIF